MKTPSTRILPLFCLSCCLVGCMDASVSETIEHSIPLAANGSIELVNINGPIEIEAWDRDEVSLVLVKTAKNKQHLEALAIEIDSQPDTLRIETKHTKTEGFFSRKSSGSVSYRLMAPARLHTLKVEAVNSRISLRGVGGSVELTTVNGPIDATAISGDAKLKTVNGSIRLDLVTTPPAGAIELRTVNGSCSITLPPGLAADVKANTVNGRIHLKLPTTESSVTRRSVVARLGSGGVPIDLNTVNGSVTIQ